MYQHDLRLRAEDVRLLGLIINIGLVGHIYPPRRRWLTTHFIRPQADPEDPYTIVTLPLSLWNQFDDTFLHADSTILDELATIVGMTEQQFSTALEQRADCLQELSQGRGIGPQEMRKAIRDLRSRS
jgi:hypothetical protein